MNKSPYLPSMHASMLVSRELFSTGKRLDKRMNHDTSNMQSSKEYTY